MEALSLFEQFWGAYPRRVAKRMALKAFLRLSPDEQRKAVAVMPLQAKAWRGTETRFIPHAATWLNQGRFDDDFEVSLTPSERWMEALYGHGAGGEAVIRRVHPGLGVSDHVQAVAGGNPAGGGRDVD